MTQLWAFLGLPTASNLWHDGTLCSGNEHSVTSHAEYHRNRAWVLFLLVSLFPWCLSCWACLWSFGVLSAWAPKHFKGSRKNPRRSWGFPWYHCKKSVHTYQNSKQIIFCDHVVVITYRKFFFRNRTVHAVITVLELHMDYICRKLKFIQYRTGVWKCHRSLSPDPSPSTG